MTSRSTAGLLVWHVAEETCTVEANLVSHLGLSAADGTREVSLSSIVARIHPEDRERAVLDSRNSLASGMPYASTFRMHDAAGDIMHVHQTGWWTFDRSGLPQSLMVTTSVSDDPVVAANGAFIRAHSLVEMIRRLAIDEGWRNVQYLADVMNYSLRTTMQNVQDVNDI